MEFPFLKTGVILAFVTLLGGCDSTESTLGGAGVGVATGALLGHAIGGRGGAALGGVIGGLGGGALGHSIGRQQTEAKNQAAQYKAESEYYQRENEYLRNHGSQLGGGGYSSQQESVDQEKRLRQLKFEAEEARLRGELAKFQFGSIATELVDSSSGASKAYNSVENLEEFSEEDPAETAVESQEGDKKVIRQIACVVDHTQKTRCLFEINKGCNKNRAIDVNAVIENDVRRIPFQNMIYIADGPSDVPAFSVIRGHGGKAFAVYNPEDEREFEQNDRMLAAGRIDAYGPADYRESSTTTRWLRMHLKKIAQRIVDEECRAAEDNPGKPPEHLH